VFFGFFIIIRKGYFISIVLYQNTGKKGSALSFLLMIHTCAGASDQELSILFGQ